jgi:hypothetical protein
VTAAHDPDTLVADPTHHQELRAFFEESYFLLLLDQYRDGYAAGLWGRSWDLKDGHSLKPEPSISLTWYAIEAILAYRTVPSREFMQPTLDGLRRYRLGDGSYTALKGDVSRWVRVQSTPLPSARHTAGALLVNFGVTGRIDKEDVLSLRSLCDSVNADGGWGAGGDPERPGAKSEPLSTALVLRALSEARKLGFGSVEQGMDVSHLMERGTAWLSAYFTASGHWRTFADQGTIADTAWVVSTYPNIAQLRDGAGSGVMGLLASSQNSNGGWPREPGGESEALPTIWCLRALLSVDSQSDANAVTRGLGFLLQSGWDLDDNPRGPYTPEWASLVWIASLIRTQPSSDRLARVENLASNLQARMAKYTAGYHAHFKHRLRLEYLSRPVRRILEKRLPSRRWLERVDHWARVVQQGPPPWVWAAVAGGIAILGILVTILLR